MSCFVTPGRRGFQGSVLSPAEALGYKHELPSAQEFFLLLHFFVVLPESSEARSRSPRSSETDSIIYSGPGEFGLLWFQVDQQPRSKELLNEL